MSDNTHRFPSSDDTAPLPPYAGGGQQHPSGATTTPGTQVTQVPQAPHDAPRDPLGPGPHGPYAGGPSGHGGPGGPVLPPPAPPSGGRQRRPGAGRAGLLVGALVLGVGGGVLGAAGWDATQGDDTSTPAAESSSSTATAARSPLTTSSSDGTDSAGNATGSDSVEGVSSTVLPSVVKINVAGPTGAGSGSGIILSSDGEILTNNHVVEVAGDSGEMTVNFNDGTTAKASIVGTDPVTDLAVIKAEGVSGLTPATLGDSNKLDVGEGVVAIGSPFGLEATVTSGIVSSLNRPVSIQETDQNTGQTVDTVYPAIQTDAAINPGNSGGPLVNMAGQVVGINSSIRSSSSGAESQGGSIGLGFAIPISKVLPIVDQLRNGETATHAKLGVTVSESQSSDATLTNGATIADVSAGSAAEKAGLQAGDVVTKVDDESISSVDALVATIRGYRPGDTVTLTYVRDGKTATTQATLDSDAGSTSS